MERKLIDFMLIFVFFLILLSSCADFGRQRGGMSDNEAAKITEQLKKELKQ